MKKKLCLGLCIITILGCLAGCSEGTPIKENSSEQEKKHTEETMQQINNSVGMPNVTNYFEKKMVKKIFELRDKADLICYAYTKNDMTGKYTYLGKCIGYGIPYSVQYTAPEKLGIVDNGYDAGDNPYTLPQPDPNGLYMPDGLSATWLIMVDEKTGEQHPMYVEPEIIVSQTKLPNRLCDETTLPSDY